MLGAFGFVLNDESRLTKQLLLNYESGSKYARPVAKASDAVEVKHGVSLQSIEYIDTYSNRATLDIWESYVSITDNIILNKNTIPYLSQP